MSRFAVLGTALLLGACSKPLAAEKTSLFPTMYEFEEGSYAALFSITMGVNAVGRDLDTELEMNVGGLLPEGTTVDAAFTDPFLQPIPTFEPGAHTGNVAIAFAPKFRTCEDTGYTERDTGGCEVSVIGFVTSNDAWSPRVGFIARAMQTDGFTGSPDSIVIDLEVIEAEPEER